MLLADVERTGPGMTGPVRLTTRAPALERLAPLWPSVPRQVRGSATVELEAPDLGFGAYEGRLTLRVPEAEVLDGRLTLRQLSAEVPMRRGGEGSPNARAAPAGRITVDELVGFGVVVYELAGKAKLVDERLTLGDLEYGLYSGRGQGTVLLELGEGGLSAHARLTGEGVRLEEFIAAYGVKGGTMTGLMRYDLDMRYGGRLEATGRVEVPDGGTVTIELLDRLLEHAEADPSGVVKRALGNLRAFDYQAADMTVRTAPDDVRLTLSIEGRPRLGIFPARVREINIRDMPLGFLARQFPGL
jgi:hypothetical protein